MPELELARRLIGFFGKTHQDVHNPGVAVCRGVKEKSVFNKTLDGGYRTTLFGGSWANDGNGTKLCVQEERWLRHDQVRLGSVCLGWILWIKIRESEIAVGNVGSVAGLVLPSLEVHDLRPTDTQQNSQNFEVGHLLSQHRVQN